MNKKSANAKSWLGVAAGSVMAMSAGMAQASVEVESNDTFATANAGGNTTMVGNIGDATAPSNDVDIWSFDLGAGTTFNASLSYNGLYNEYDTNPIMTLFWENNGSYYPVATTDATAQGAADPLDFGGQIGNLTWSSSISFTPWATGNYFMSISADFNQGVDAFGNYQSDAAFMTTENITGTAFDHFNGQSFTSFGYGVTATGAVPVPAAVWLFGSGLLGLIGVSRRKNQNA